MDQFLNYDGVTDAIWAGLVRSMHIFLSHNSYKRPLEQYKVVF